eukprot:3846899-Amphidinium_carterae.2
MAEGSEFKTNPKWLDSDLLKMDAVETQKVKLQVAHALDLRYGLFNPDKPGSVAFAGIPGFDPMRARRKHEVIERLSKDPKHDDVKWKTEYDEAIRYVCTVTALQLRWDAAGTPWNAGYIESWFEATCVNGTGWDSLLERRAGGYRPDRDNNQNMTTTGSSSLMGLITRVVGQVMRGEDVNPAWKAAFCRIRLVIYIGATQDEMAALNASENIEQHERKRHNELDNIFQVREWMKQMQQLRSQYGLDPTKAIDVVKYALALGDPRDVWDCPEWLRGLLQKKAVTFSNKLMAVSMKGVTKKFMDSSKVAIKHPQMNSYARVVTRVKALNGFDEWDRLFSMIAEEMGRLGLSAKAFPLPQTLLLSPDILNSRGFATTGEKECVPAWRDGQLGAELQYAMCVVAKERAFDWGFVKSGKPVFASGGTWSAFARLAGPPHNHLEATLVKHFGSKPGWSNAVLSIHRSIWAGDHDLELCKLSSVIPATFDRTPPEMLKRLSEWPVVQNLVQSQSSEADRLVGMQMATLAEENKKAEQEKAIAAENITGIPGIVDDGDVTDSPIFAQQTMQERTATCD